MKPLPHKIISGGQTGADEGGLLAAYTWRRETGGQMPKGFRRHGSTPGSEVNATEFGKQFGMTQSRSREYPPRTRHNIQNSDGTLIFTTLQGCQSRGVVLTERLCVEFNKQYNVIIVDARERPGVIDVVAWILASSIRTLNVAGNSESSAPGIGKYVEGFMGLVLAECDRRHRRA